MNTRQYIGGVGLAASLLVAGCAASKAQKAMDVLGVKDKSELVKIGDYLTTASLKERLLALARQLAEKDGRKGALELWIKTLLADGDGNPKDGALSELEVKSLEETRYIMPQRAPYDSYPGVY